MASNVVPEMKTSEIIDVQLESFFGRKFPQKIQHLVDEELNHGPWVDGYELAVCDGVIDGDDARKSNYEGQALMNSQITRDRPS